MSITDISAVWLFNDLALYLAHQIRIRTNSPLYLTLNLHPISRNHAYPIIHTVWIVFLKSLNAKNKQLRHDSVLNAFGVTLCNQSTDG
jgi:hypothetical protein